MNNSANLKITAHRDSEIVLPDWLMNTAPFDDPSRLGEAQGTAVVVEQAGKTTLTITLLHEPRQTCDGLLDSPVAPCPSPGYLRHPDLSARPAELLAMTLALGEAQAGL
jgi:hypothetical protein